MTYFRSKSYLVLSVSVLKNTLYEFSNDISHSYENLLSLFKVRKYNSFGNSSIYIPIFYTVPHHPPAEWCHSSRKKPVSVRIPYIDGMEKVIY